MTAANKSLDDMAPQGKKHGNWVPISVADEGTITAEIDLGAEFYSVQVYNPAIDSATMTVKPSRLSGEAAVQAYLIADGQDKVNTTTARTGAGMNIFDSICARYVTIVFGAAQNGGPYTLYVRGLFPI